MLKWWKFSPLIKACASSMNCTIGNLTCSRHATYIQSMLNLYKSLVGHTGFDLYVAGLNPLMFDLLNNIVKVVTFNCNCFSSTLWCCWPVVSVLFQLENSIDSPSVKLKILTTSRQFNSQEWRNIITHMGNWRRICFSHYFTRTLLQNPLTDRLDNMRGKARDILIL